MDCANSKYGKAAGYAVNDNGTHFVMKTNGKNDGLLLYLRAGEEKKSREISNVGHANDCTCAGGKLYVVKGGGGENDRTILCIDQKSFEQTVLTTTIPSDVKDISSIESIGGNRFLLGKAQTCYLCTLENKVFKYQKSFRLESAPSQYGKPQGMCYASGYLYKIYFKSDSIKNIILKYPIDINNIQAGTTLSASVMYVNKHQTDRSLFEIEAISNCGNNFYVNTNERDHNDSLYKISLS